MSSGTKIIENALKMIGVHSIAMPAQPETLADGRDALNSMLQTWESRGIMIGHTPLNDVGDELNEPMDTTNAIQLSLAIYMAPMFDSGKGNATALLRGNAESEFQMVRNLYEEFTIPKKVVSSTTPLGEGNRNNAFGRAYFGQNNKLDN